MFKFNITLNRKDIKKFSLYSVGFINKKFLFVIILCILSFVFLFFYIFFAKATFFHIIISFIFLLFFFSIIKKLYFSSRKVYIKGLEFVGKERAFLVDELYLEIFDEKNSVFFGRYYFYDLKRYEKFRKYIYLFFNEKVFIIVPLRFLKKEEVELFCKILDKNLNGGDIS